LSHDLGHHVQERVTDPVARRTVDLKASVSHPRGAEPGVVGAGAGVGTDGGEDEDQVEGWVLLQ